MGPSSFHVMPGTSTICRRSVRALSNLDSVCRKSNCCRSPGSKTVLFLVSCLFAIPGDSPSLLHVLRDIRFDGRQFVVRLVNTVDVFLQCSRQTQQNVSDLLEVTTMVDYLMLRLRISLQELWVKNSYRCRCVIAARVVFPELRRVVVDFL